MVEFIVRRWHDEYVATVDNYDGDTTYTRYPEHARIFSGKEWYQIWRDRVGHEIIFLPRDPTVPKGE